MLSSKPKHPCHSRFFVHELTNRQLIHGPFNISNILLCVCRLFPYLPILEMLAYL